MLDERSVQTVSRPFNIFKNKENVESMLIESLNQFKFDSTRFQRYPVVSLHGRFATPLSMKMWLFLVLKVSSGEKLS